MMFPGQTTLLTHSIPSGRTLICENEALMFECTTSEPTLTWVLQQPVGSMTYRRNDPVNQVDSRSNVSVWLVDNSALLSKMVIPFSLELNGSNIGCRGGDGEPSSVPYRLGLTGECLCVTMYIVVHVEAEWTNEISLSDGHVRPYIVDGMHDNINMWCIWDHFWNSWQECSNIFVIVLLLVWGTDCTKPEGTKHTRDMVRKCHASRVPDIVHYTLLSLHLGWFCEMQCKYMYSTSCTLWKERRHCTLDVVGVPYSMRHINGDVFVPFCSVWSAWNRFYFWFIYVPLRTISVPLRCGVAPCLELRASIWRSDTPGSMKVRRKLQDCLTVLVVVSLELLRHSYFDTDGCTLLGSSSSTAAHCDHVSSWLL